MQKPRGWDKMTDSTLGDNVREYHGDACNYVVPWVDESATREDVDQLLSEVESYIRSTVPNVPEGALSKLSFGQIVCEGVKRVQTVYTNDPNRWPKGNEYKEFTKGLNAAMAAGDTEAFRALAKANPELWTRYDEAETAKENMRKSMS